MINLKVDEGFAFDYIAILAVKLKRGLISEDLFHQYKRDMEYELGEELCNKVMASEEYQEMVEVNDSVFIVVDLAKGDAVKASIVNNLNDVRFQKKKALQNKFFPDKKLTEVKNSEITQNNGALLNFRKIETNDRSEK